VNEPTDGQLPPGWRLEPDPHTRLTDAGTTLVGGSPLRILRLSGLGARWVERIFAGEPVPTTPAVRSFAQRLVDAGIAHPLPSPDGPYRSRDVAVVIPVRDDVAGVERTLASLGDVGEVIVVDDGSTNPDDVSIVVRRSCPVPSRTRVLRNVVARGPGGARNVGWRGTTLPVVAFVDADVEMDAEWLPQLLAHFGDPAVRAVAPRVRARPGSAPSWLARYEVEHSPLDMGPQSSRVRPGARVSYLPTASLVVRRDALEVVGGFDEAMRYGEDVDLVWRMDRAGWTVRYEARVTGRHPCRPSFTSWLRQRVAYGSSASPLARRHGRAVAPVRISGWSALTWTLILFGYRRIGVGLGVATTAATVPKLRSSHHPVREAVAIAGRGNLFAGQQVALALRRTWLPLTVVLAARCRRARPAIVAALLLPAFETPRSDGPPRMLSAALKIVDDAAYAVGVWVGCARQRTVVPLLPAFSGPLRVPTASPDPNGRSIATRNR